MLRLHKSHLWRTSDSEKPPTASFVSHRLARPHESQITLQKNDMTRAVNVTFLLLKVVSCFTLEPVVWVMGDNECLMGSGTGVCLSVVTLLSPGGPYWNKSKIWQNTAGIADWGEFQIFYFILYCNISIKHNYHYVLSLLDWPMRCCLIALNHHIVNHYEFLFVRNKIANIKKSLVGIFSPPHFWRSHGIYYVSLMRPREQQYSPHIHTEHLLNSLEDNWNDKHRTLVIFIKSTHLFASQRQKLHSTAHLCWRQMWAQV